MCIIIIGCGRILYALALFLLNVLGLDLFNFRSRFVEKSHFTAAPFSMSLTIIGILETNSLQNALKIKETTGSTLTFC